MIENLLKEKVNGLDKIKLTEAVLKESENKCYLTFLVNSALDEDVQKECLTLCHNALGVNVALKFKRAFLDKDKILYVVNQFLKQHYLNIFSMLSEDDLKIEIDDKINISLFLIEDLKLLSERNGFREELKEWLSGEFFEDVNISLFEKQIDLEKSIKALEKRFDEPEQTSKATYVKVDEVEDYIGEKITRPPVAIYCVKHAEEEICLAGKIRFFQQKSFVKERNGEKIERIYFTFVLDDGTESINVTYFPSKATLPKMEKITDGVNVVMFGQVEYFRDKLSFKPKDISLCGGFQAIKPSVKYKGVPESYITISPEPYQEFEQVNMMDDPTAQKEEVSEFLKTHSVVVFDLETTGLSSNKDEIIELGACKIENGKITQTFQTLIKPSIPIPEETIKVHGITDKMVENCPSFKDVCGDFYKFAHGSVLVAYNAEFDKGFIDFHAGKLLYKFDNDVIDAMAVAKMMFKGLANYKLVTVLNKMGIVNEGAHRAVHDAIATAKAFLVLSKLC